MKRPVADEKERGAILLLGALIMTALMAVAALSVNIGGETINRRNDQSVADMAALDGVQHLASSQLTQEVMNSLSRNHFTAANDQLTSLQTGTWSNGTFTVTAQNAANAVKVSVSNKYNDFLRSGSQTLIGTSIAYLANLAQFQIGSTLATVATCPTVPASSPSSCSLLNGLLSNLGVSTGMSLVGYQGLVSAPSTTVAALGTSLGLSALTPTQILATKVSEYQLVEGELNLLGSDGQTTTDLSALATQLLASSTDTNNTFALGSALGITQGNGVGLGTSVNLLNVLTGGAELANQSAGLSVPLTTLTLPAGLGSTTLSLTAIVPAAQSPYAAPGTSNSAEDAQVTLGLTVKVGVSDGLLGILSTTLPLKITVGDDTAYVQSVNGCTSSTSTPTGITTPITFNNVTVNIVNGSILGFVGTVSGSIVEPSNSLTSTEAYANNFSNQYVSTGGNVNVVASSNPGTPSINVTATVLGLPVGPLIGTALDGVLGTVFTAVDPILSSVLSIHIGSADLLGLRASCGTAALAQ